METAHPDNGPGAARGRQPDRIPAGAALRRVAAAITAFGRKVSEDEVSLFAMSLTYTTILSMVPLLAVTFSVLKAFGVHDQIEPLLAQSLAPLGGEGEWLAEVIIDFVRNMQVGVLGAAGVAGLFYTVVMLVAAIEAALNRIWHARQGRPWSSRFSGYLSVIMVGPVLVFTAFALTASAQQHALVQRAFALAPGLVWFVTAILPYVIMAVAFTLLYRFMPNTVVTWPAALTGGVIAGIAWKWAGTAFAVTVVSSGRYAAIYSGFAILILFFLWVYLSWLIVLLGSEIAYWQQYPRDVLERLQRATIVGRETIGLVVLRALARRHLDGAAPTSAGELAAITGLPAATVEEIAEDMVRHAVLLDAQRPAGFALARPPESIAVYDLLCILRGEVEGSAPGHAIPATVASALGIRADAARSALDGISLRSLAEKRDADVHSSASAGEGQFGENSTR